MARGAALPPENFAGLAELRRTSGIPIAAGERFATLMDFERLLAAKAVNFVQPSPAKMGGISVLRKVIPLAAVHNNPVMPHAFYDGPGLPAAIHATAALGTPHSMIGWHWFDLQAPVYGGALTAKRGRVCLRDRALQLTPIQISSGLTEGNEATRRSTKSANQRVATQHR